MRSSGLSLQEISRLGRKVDPVILRAISTGTDSDFLACLRYHFRMGGKRMRAAMVILSCGAAGGRISDSVTPAAVVEMIHNYSLVIDDIIDRGELRRGKPTVRVKFGEAIAILVAMNYREVLDELVQHCDHRDTIRRISVHAMKEIIDGERLDLQFEQAGRKDAFLRENRIEKPDFQLYLRMIGKKTASLFQTAAELGAYSADGSSSVVKALGAFGWKSGLAFQIMDDVLDIFGEGTGKEGAKDVIEHKLGNAALLIATRYLPGRERRELGDILRSPVVSRGRALRVVELVSKTPAELECKQVASRFLQEAKDHLRSLTPSRYVTSLSELGDRVIARSY